MMMPLSRMGIHMTTLTMMLDSSKEKTLRGRVEDFKKKDRRAGTESGLGIETRTTRTSPPRFHPTKIKMVMTGERWRKESMNYCRIRDTDLVLTKTQTTGVMMMATSCLIDSLLFPSPKKTIKSQPHHRERI